MELRFITWNLKGGDPRQLELLEALVTDKCVVALQEVSPSFVEPLHRWEHLDWMRCAFELRPPRKYDGKNRELATVVGATGGMHPIGMELVPDTLLPERTLAVTVQSPAGPFVACSFHALAGTSFRTGKILMFRALTRWLEAQTLPVVFGVDRNAPKTDHPDDSQIEWYWPGDTREPLIFGTGAPHGCKDAYRQLLAANPAQLDEIRRARPYGPLATTYERGESDDERTPCRYDAIYVSPHFEVGAMQHEYAAALEAGSDHGLVVADLRIG